MDLDLDDVLHYPEDDFDFQDGNANGPEEGNGGNNGEPLAPKRRNMVTNEFASRVAALDDAVLDASLDWYLRIDLVDDKASAQQREYDRKLNDAVQRVLQARKSKLEPNERENEEDDRSSRNTTKVYIYPPDHNPYWLPVTTPLDKSRLYITMKADDGNKPKTAMPLRVCGRGQLLGQDFQDILENAKKMNECKIADEGARAPENAEVPDTCTVYFTEPMDSEPHTMRMADESPKSETALWVEKYKPRSYIDLLSDDGVNRTLLTWLKLWDECVFGRKRCQRSVTSIKRFTGPSVFKELAAKKANFTTGRFKKASANAFNDADKLPTTLDDLKRPVHKIALLSGPPGVGKTTLAQIVARHAGYYVQEMNASDDRSLEAFKKQLEGATQMQATLDGVKKPHCLVIDEIDGAPIQSVNFLVSLTSQISDTANGNELTNKPATSKTKSGMIIRRPIICICNDLYANSLRELRKIALVIHVPPIENSRMADRICHIARREAIIAEPGCFELMCSKAGFDVRSCINSLQLMTSGQQSGGVNKRLTLAQVMETNCGSKDMQRSLFSAWQDVFQLPKSHKRSSTGESSASVLSSRVKNVLQACEECGEEDRFRAGLFENYLSPEYRDPRLESVSTGLDWLGFIDQLDLRVAQTQLYELKRYNGYLAAVFHLLFATRQFPKLSFPQMIQETQFKISRMLSTLHSLLSDVNHSVRPFLDCNILVLEVLPFVLDLVNPQLRAVNVQLYSIEEKALLQRVVAIMRDYNLTYRQQRSVSGDYDFVLEPPVEEVIRFGSSSSSGQRPGKPSYLSRKPPLSNTTKQAIAHEIELAKVRQKEPRRDVNTPINKSNPRPGGIRPLALPSTEVQDQIPNGQNWLSCLAQRLTIAGNVSSTREHRNDAATDSQVWYKYIEGCNDAVRRRLRVSDLV